MRQITPIDAALELIDCLEGGKPLPDHVKKWWLQGLKLYRGGHVASLEEGLGLQVLPGKSNEKLPNIWRRAERDYLIYSIGQELDLKRRKVAAIITQAMEHSVPEVESREAQTMLIKLRNLCQSTPFTLQRSRIMEILRDGGNRRLYIRPVE